MKSKLLIFSLVALFVFNITLGFGIISNASEIGVYYTGETVATSTDASPASTGDITLGIVRGNSWGDETSYSQGFDVFITNNSSEILTDYYVQFNFVEEFILSQNWNCQATVNVNFLTITNEYDIPPGGSVSMGFIVNSSSKVYVDSAVDNAKLYINGEEYGGDAPAPGEDATTETLAVDDTLYMSQTYTDKTINDIYSMVLSCRNVLMVILFVHVLRWFDNRLRTIFNRNK